MPKPPLPGQKPAQRESAEQDEARNDHGGAAPANNKKQNQRQEQIELVFDRERPGVGEGGAAVKADILHGQEKFPGWKHFRIFAP